MYINSEAIVFRQIKAAGGRRMLLLFTKKYGKISAGSNISEKGRGKAALALRPFAYGDYELFKNRDFYNLNSGEVKKSFFRIGENLDKYMQASIAMELTEKVLPEGLPQPKIFNLLVEFLSALENREKSHETLLLAYEIKLLELMGTLPETEQCACCGSKDELDFFSVIDGGMICNNCRKIGHERLIYQPEFDIVSILNYFLKMPMSKFEKLALNEDVAVKLQQILREYLSYHLDVGSLKSDDIFEERI
ncbi:MAG: DNA repair protein RecO [Eubacteriaceae bacterium]|nr:DNA repair protein RecO [Eubacteriaceae bacterium]